MIKTAVLLTALCLTISFAKDVTLNLKTKTNQDIQPPYNKTAPDEVVGAGLGRVHMEPFFRVFGDLAHITIFPDYRELYWSQSCCTFLVVKPHKACNFCSLCIYT